MKGAPARRARAPSARVRRVAKAPPPSAALSPEFERLIEVFVERPGVTRAKMMGCHGLRLANKYFAMEWRGALVVKLPRDAVEQHAAEGRGTQFDPGMGRPMKEWLTVPEGVADWRHLAEQAFDFVAASL